MIINGTINLDAGAVANTHVIAGARISDSKVDHQRVIGCDFGKKISEAPAAGEFVVYRARTDETVTSFEALLYDSGTSTAVDFDLKKNGVSILSAVIPIVHGTGDRVTVSGNVTSGNLVAGDVLTMSLAVTSSTGALGPYAQCAISSPYAQ